MEDKIIQIKHERITELISRFESALRMYKFVINNPKYYDRSLHIREAEHLHKYLEDFKKELSGENSNN